MPFFSVVIPTFNREHLITATINSALAQDFDDFEIIVVDDGSTDDTEAVIEGNFSHDSRVRYLKQVNSERGAARNHGFRSARGRYVLFLDSDDVMHANHLSALSKIVADHPEVNFLATKFVILRDGERLRTPDLESIEEGWHGVDLFLRGDPIGSVFCVRRDNPRIKLFEEDRRYAIMEDWMFVVQNLVGDRIYIRDEVTISVTDHPQRSMQGDNREIIKKKLLAKDWIVRNVALSEDQARILEAYAHYFCAIHGYLDDDRTLALKHLGEARRKFGLKIEFVTLFVKILAGRKLIRRVANRS